MWDSTFFPTDAGYGTSAQRCLGAEYESTAQAAGLVGAPSSIAPWSPGQVPTWEILRGSSALWRRCCKSPFPWQGMELREQPGLIYKAVIRAAIPLSQFPGVPSLSVLVDSAGLPATGCLSARPSWEHA